MIACNYCGRKCQIVDGLTLYPHRGEFINRKFVKCEACAAWTLLDHNGRPIGPLANVTLHAKRRRALEALKPLWVRVMENGAEEKTAKASAYLWLTESLGLNDRPPRINSFDEELCDLTIQLCNETIMALKGAEA